MAARKRVLLIHWNAGEARERAGRLEEAGFAPEPFRPRDASSLRGLKENPPDAIVIDLGRTPSHGREVATAIRRQKSTRAIPLVFVAGEPEKVARVRELLPDAVYAEWGGIREAVEGAIRNPPAAPAAPGAMAAYSGTPLAARLGIRAGATVALLGAPPDLESKLEGLPENVKLVKALRGGAELILLFAKSRAVLERRFEAAAEALRAGGGIWILWPKKTSGVASDLTRTAVRAFGLGRAFVDYKICAVDETWSGLLFARRKRA